LQINILRYQVSQTYSGLKSFRMLGGIDYPNRNWVSGAHQRHTFRQLL